MVQTRRTTWSATQDQPQNTVIQPTINDDTKRPQKRAKAGHQPDARVASTTAAAVVSVEPREHARESKRAGFETTQGENKTDPAPAKRPRRKQAVSEPSDFVPRVPSAWKVGAHVSAAGGVENVVINAARVGANAFALFVKSQRKWVSPALKDEHVASFKARMNKLGYDPKYVLPHGSYLINLANPDAAKREKSYECFLDDLQRCERLGLMYYNFHPGSTVGNATKEESISLIAQCLNRAHKETSLVTTVIENMAGAKNIIGSRFEELRGIIEQVVDKSRIGVCLDTCHLYAAGYDIATKEGWNETMAAFDEQVGLSYLRGMHLNDSKTPLGSKKDRHENIGLGTLGLSAFRAILSDPRVQNIPLILETPSFEAVEIWEREIGVLNRLTEMGTGSATSMDEQGEKEEDTLKEMRDEIQAVVRKHGDHKASEKSATKAKTKSSKRKKANDEEEDACSECEV